MSATLHKPPLTAILYRFTAGVDHAEQGNIDWLFAHLNASQLSLLLRRLTLCRLLMTIFYRGSWQHSRLIARAQHEEMSTEAFALPASKETMYPRYLGMVVTEMKKFLADDTDADAIHEAATALTRDTARRWQWLPETA